VLLEGLFMFANGFGSWNPVKKPRSPLENRHLGDVFSCNEGDKFCEAWSTCGMAKKQWNSHIFASYFKFACLSKA
jgi:hypothetical protein